MTMKVLHSDPQTQIWDVETLNPSKKSELSRFGGLSFFHNIELLRRKYPQEVFAQYPSLEKNEKAFVTFLERMEAMRSQTPCLIGRFRADNLMAILSSVTKETVNRCLTAFEKKDRSHPLYLTDYNCETMDGPTGDTHVSILGYLTAYKSEGGSDEDFYQFSLRNMAERLNPYVEAITELNAQRSDLEYLMTYETADQKLFAAQTMMMGLVSYRFGFPRSSWEPQMAFGSLAKAVKEQGPQILYGKFPPFCYQATPKKKGEIGGREVLGWEAGAEKIERLFDHSIIVVGVKKGERKNLVFYISPYTYYENTQLYVSSYETICELARYCFSEVYAVHLS